LLHLHLLYRNVLPPSSNSPNCSLHSFSLSLVLSFLPLPAFNSTFSDIHNSPSRVLVSSSVMPDLRQRTSRGEKRTIYHGISSCSAVRYRRAQEFQFAFTRSFSLFLLTLLTPSALCARSREGARRPVPWNTYARLFARSIDGLINVSTVGRRRHGLGAHRGHSIDQSRASSISFAADSCIRDIAVIVRARRRRYRDVTRSLTPPSVAFPLRSLSLSPSLSFSPSSPHVFKVIRPARRPVCTRPSRQECRMCIRANFSAHLDIFVRHDSRASLTKNKILID